jgi:NAD(P)-dependent dehydrogenase (short-subunit alcohol dehydrogenase family)
MIPQYDLTDKIVVITGGAGMLGQRHAEVVCELKGVPVILDIDQDRIDVVVDRLNKDYGVGFGLSADIASERNIKEAVDHIVSKFGSIHVLINNAALTARGMAERAADCFASFEDYRLDIWEEMVKVNLTGHFICSKLIGKHMIQKKHGVIINIASEIGLIGPDQRIYKGIKNPYTGGPLSNPPGYSVTKAGLIHMTKYLAACWGQHNIRVNTLCPGGVYDNHEENFVKNYSNLVPLARMAFKDEYKGAIAFLATDASSFMTGSTLVVDGGKTCW